MIYSKILAICYDLLNKIYTHNGRFQKKKKKLMEFSIKGPDPASQHLNGKKNKIKHGLKML